MSLRINQNIDALNSYRNLSVTQGQMSKSLEKLSSGYRINRAADDAAGLAISEGLRSQVGGIKVAVRNAQDGVSVVQTAEGALTETHSILQRMRDLAVQAANDSNDQTSRDAIQSESAALNKELDRIASKTTFNNINLLDGSFNGKDFQVGYASGDTIQVDVGLHGRPGRQGDVRQRSRPAPPLPPPRSPPAACPSPRPRSTASTDSTNIAGQLNNDKAFATAFTATVTATGGLEIKSKNAALVGHRDHRHRWSRPARRPTPPTRTGTGGFSSDGPRRQHRRPVDQGRRQRRRSPTIDTAIKAVSTSRANLGALQNRFEHTINNLNVPRRTCPRRRAASATPTWPRR